MASEGRADTPRVPRDRQPRSLLEDSSAPFGLDLAASSPSRGEPSGLPQVRREFGRKREEREAEVCVIIYSTLQAFTPFYAFSPLCLDVPLNPLSQCSYRCCLLALQSPLPQPPCVQALWNPSAVTGGWAVCLQRMK